MSDFSVSTTDELSQALSSAQAGDTIALAPGVYSGVNASGLNFAAAVNVVSQDPANEAVLTDLSVIQSSGLHFQNLEFAGSAANVNMPFVIVNSSQIDLENISFHNQTADDFSILLTAGSSDISLHNTNGEPILVSPNVMSSAPVDFVTSAPDHFPGLPGWFFLGDATSLTLTNPTPEDVGQGPDPSPPASIAAIDASDPPIVMTGLAAARHADLNFAVA